jgi:hypothetical protein
LGLVPKYIESLSVNSHPFARWPTKKLAIEENGQFHFHRAPLLYVHHSLVCSSREWWTYKRGKATDTGNLRFMQPDSVPCFYIPRFRIFLNFDNYLNKTILSFCLKKWKYPHKKSFQTSEQTTFHDDSGRTLAFSKV